jgi:hypothetical protein
MCFLTCEENFVLFFISAPPDIRNMYNEREHQVRERTVTFFVFELWEVKNCR